MEIVHLHIILLAWRIDNSCKSDQNYTWPCLGYSLLCAYLWLFESATFRQL